MLLTDTLMEVVRDIWQAYYEHPFVLGIQNGTLDRARFRHYILQDALYLVDYAKVFAIGVAKAKGLETASLFAKYIPVMNGELNIHEGYLARLQVSGAEMDSTAPALDNLSYTSYMLRVAYEEGEAEILAAILACAYSYERIAEEMVKKRPQSVQHEFFGDWIRGYAAPAYAADNQILLDTLNRLTEAYTPAQRQHIVDIFTACSRYELAFWDMAWDMKK